MLVMQARAGRTHGTTMGHWRAQPKEQVTARAGFKKPLSMKWNLSLVKKYADESDSRVNV